MIKRFQALDGYRFTGESGAHYTLRAGQYPTGTGAFAVLCENGEGECILTVNMLGCADEIGSDEFWVRLETISFSEAPRALLQLGIFVDTGRVQAGPWGQPYAQIWRFA